MVWWWGSRVWCMGACSKYILGHWEGMISQRCSSPQLSLFDKMSADLLAVSKHASICHHRWCQFLIWVSQIRMCTIKRFFKSTVMLQNDKGGKCRIEDTSFNRLFPSIVRMYRFFSKTKNTILEEYYISHICTYMHTCWLSSFEK